MLRLCSVIDTVLGGGRGYTGRLERSDSCPDGGHKGEADAK